MTRNSWIAFNGNGLPRLASCPATPPAVKSFLKLVPSMNTFTLSAGNAPPANVLKVLFRPLFKTVVPGASATRPRKLRSDSGRFSTWWRVTFVATSEVRVSTPLAPCRPGGPPGRPRGGAGRRAGRRPPPGGEAPPPPGPPKKTGVPAGPPLGVGRRRGRGRPRHRIPEPRVSREASPAASGAGA